MFVGGMPLGLFGFGLPGGFDGLGWLLGGMFSVRLGFRFGCSSLLPTSH